MQLSGCNDSMQQIKNKQ